MRSPTRLSPAIAAYALFLTTGVDAFFRINCAKVMHARVDPLVNPGAIAQHAHTIVGASSKLLFGFRLAITADGYRYRRQRNIQLAPQF